MSNDQTTDEQLLDLNFQPPQEPTPEQQEFQRDEERRQEELRQAVLEKLPGNVPLPNIYDVEADESHGVDDSMLSQGANNSREIEAEDDTIATDLSSSIHDQIDNQRNDGNTWQASTPFIANSQPFDTSKGISFVTPPHAPKFPSNVYHIAGDVNGVNNFSDISELTQNLMTGFDHEQDLAIIEQVGNDSRNSSPREKILQPEQRKVELHQSRNSSNNTSSPKSPTNNVVTDTSVSAVPQSVSEVIGSPQENNRNLVIPTAGGINVPLFESEEVTQITGNVSLSSDQNNSTEFRDNKNYVTESNVTNEQDTTKAREHGQHSNINSESSSSPIIDQDTSPIYDNVNKATVTQLRILYEARGRKVNELNEQLSALKEDGDRQIRILQHKVLLSQDECQALHSNVQQFQSMISERTIECDELRNKLSATEDEIRKMRSDRDEAISKLHIAECSIEALNQQISEYSRSETIVRSREQHDKIVASLKERHQEEVYELKEMHDKTASQLAQLNADKEKLESELINNRKRSREAELDHTEAIKKLTQNLHEFQNRYTKVLEEGSVKDVFELRDQLHRAETAKAVSEGLCEDLQKEITELKDQCKMYESALKLGVQTSGISHVTLNESLSRNSDTSFQWSNDSNIQPDELINNLRVELDRCIASNAAKRSEINQLRSELKETYKDLKIEKEKCSRSELICSSLENRIQQLEIDLKCEKDAQVGESNSERILRQQNKQLREDYDDICSKWQQVKRDLSNKLSEIGQLNDRNSELEASLALTKHEAEKDKQESVERCRLMCQHLHETAINQLKTGMMSAFEETKEKLVQQHRDEINLLMEEIDVLRNELHKAKEAYVHLADEQSLTESRLREEYQKIADEAVAKAIEQTDNIKDISKEGIDISILAREESILSYTTQKDNMEEDLQRRLAIELAIAKTNWIEEREEKFRKAVESSVSTAKRQWEAELTATHEVQYQSRLATAKAEIQLRYEKEIDIAIEEAVSKVRKEYENELQQRIESAIKESVIETEHKLSIEYESTIEDAICKARKEIKQEMESRHKLELEVALEELSSNMKAEHRKELEIAVNEATLNSREKAKKEFSITLEDYRCKEIEKLRNDLEERYDSELNSAVENAIENAKTDWVEVYERNTIDRIKIAIKEEKKNWNDELLANQARLWEEQASQLKLKWDEIAAVERQKAIDIAITNAEIKWLREKQQAVEDGIRSARDVWLSEHKVSVVTAVENAVETARNEWNQNLTSRLSDVEQRWSADVEKQKAKEINDALSKAKTEWKTEFVYELQSFVNIEINKIFTSWASANGFAAEVLNQNASITLDIPDYAPIQQQIKETITTLLTAISNSWEHDMTRKLHEAIRKAVSETEVSVQQRLSLEFQQKIKAAMEQTELKYQQLKDEDHKQFCIIKEKALTELNQEWLEKCTKLKNDNQSIIDNLLSSLNEKFANEKAEIVKRHTNDIQQLITNQNYKNDQDLHNLRIDCEREFLNKLAIERKEWEKQNRTIKDKYDAALAKRQQMWEYERENLKQQLASAESVRQYLEQALKAAQVRFETKYKSDIELAAENLKATKQYYESKVKDITETYTTENEKLALKAKKPIVVDSVCQTDSIPELSSDYAEKLEQLGGRYMSTMLNIRQDIMRYMTQSRERTAAKMRAGILRERIDVSKRCKEQFMTCLRRLIKEDFPNLLKVDVTKFLKSVDKAMEISDLYNTGLINTPHFNKDIFSDLKRDILAFNAVLDGENSVDFSKLLPTESRDDSTTNHQTKAKNDNVGQERSTIDSMVQVGGGIKNVSVSSNVSGTIGNDQAVSFSNNNEGGKKVERRSSSTSVIDTHTVNAENNRAHSQTDFYLHKTAADNGNVMNSKRAVPRVKSPPLIHKGITTEFIAKPIPHLASRSSTNRTAKGAKNSKSPSLKRTRNVWVQSSEVESNARFGIGNLSLIADGNAASKVNTDDNLLMSSPDPDCYSELPSTMSFIKRMQNMQLKD